MAPAIQMREPCCAEHSRFGASRREKIVSSSTLRRDGVVKAVGGRDGAVEGGVLNPVAGISGHGAPCQNLYIGLIQDDVTAADRIGILCHPALFSMLVYPRLNSYPQVRTVTS